VLRNHLACKPTSHEPDHRNANECLAGIGTKLVVLGETALKAQPPEGAFDDPTPREQLESFDVVGPFHDLHAQTACSAEIRHPVKQGTRVAAVGPDESKAHERVSEDRKHELGSVAILDVGSVHNDAEDEAEGVDDQVTLASTDFFAGIVTAATPFEVVFTDWLSMIAAEGIRSRPSVCRTSPRSWS
jgi:hypothetical protein